MKLKKIIVFALMVGSVAKADPIVNYETELRFTQWRIESLTEYRDNLNEIYPGARTLSISLDHRDSLIISQ